MRIAFYIIALLFVARPLPATVMTVLCEPAQEEFVGVRKPFLTGLRPQEVAEALKTQLKKYVWEAPPVTVAFDSGEKVQIRAGRSGSGTENLLVVQMLQGKYEVGSVTFYRKDKDGVLYLSDSSTSGPFREKGVNEALFSIMLALEDTPPTVALGLADSNLTAVASRLANTKVEYPHIAERIVTEAIAAGRTQDLIAAIENCPRGRIASRAGYRLNPSSVKLIPASQAFDGRPFIKVSFQHEP